LRVMKVGGNAAFADFLARHPGDYYASNNDAKAKYSSRAANLYKEALQKRVKADEATFGPGPVVVEGANTSANGTAGAKSPANGTASGSAKEGGGGDDDFFDTWDKPAPAKLAASPPTVSGPPSVSLAPRSPALSPSNSTPGTPRSESPKPPVAAVTQPPQPRTISSSSLRSPGTTGATGPRSKLGARSTSSTAAAPAIVGGRPKLGAKKAGVTINFEEAERKAKEEEERIKRLGYDRKEEEERAAAAAAAASAAASASQSAARSGSGNGYTPAAGSSKSGHAKKESLDTERLGMGMRRLGFGQVAGVGGEQAAKEADSARKAAKYNEPEDTEASSYAKERFGNQKGISSDMYFNKGSYDPSVQQEAQQRLTQFNGATAISSNMYFGREEEEADAIQENLLGVEGLAGLEAGAKDLVRKVMDQTGIHDVQGLQDALRQGALKMSDYLARYG